MLSDFIVANREELIARCRAKVAARTIPPPTDAAGDHGVPVFLDQLVRMLRADGLNTAEIDVSASQHGQELLMKGFTVSQVVHDYGDVCQSITAMALETNAPITTTDFQMLNLCLDNAIASAVTIHTRESKRSLDENTHDTESLAFLLHELRNLVSTAVVSFAVLKSGNVGVAGSTGAVLDRSLNGLRDLVGRSVEGIRATTGVKALQRTVVAEFIEEVGTASRLQADACDLRFVVLPVEADVAFAIDRQVLTAVVGNLIQNAFKFTKANTTVTLRVRAAPTRVLIEVEDRCGGLPGQPPDAEISPAFEQRSANRTGLGIGLTFSRWGCEANGGRLYARNLPGVGCVFVVDLPRCA